jgi:hypothetical protein
MTAEPHPFAGEFDLRDWQSARPFETPSGVIAWELAGALVSCRSAVLTLAVGQPKLQLMVGGVRKRVTPIDGSLRVDKQSIRLEGNLYSDDPGRATCSLQMKNARWLQLDLRLQHDRLTATLYARNADDQPVAMQTLQFHRVGAPAAPTRRAPEKAQSPLTEPKPPAVAPPPPAPDPGASRVAEWTRSLSNTQLSDEDNDSQVGYGGSTYWERRTVLRLYNGRFVLDDSTLTNITVAGRTSSRPGRTQRTGTWSLRAVAGSTRFQLLLACDDGERVSYELGARGSDSFVVDGKAWQWRRIS